MIANGRRRPLATDGALESDHAAKLIDFSNSQCFPGLQLSAIRVEIAWCDHATALGIVARGSSPVLTLCRKLVEAGHDPATPLEAWRGGTVTGTLCLWVRSIGAGARLTVEDRPRGGKPPRFIRHRPMPDQAEGSPSIAPFGKSDQAILTAAE
jgi:hypothetical protein